MATHQRTVAIAARSQYTYLLQTMAAARPIAGRTKTTR